MRDAVTGDQGEARVQEGEALEEDEVAGSAEEEVLRALRMRRMKTILPGKKNKNWSELKLKLVLVVMVQWFRYLLKGTGEARLRDNRAEKGKVYGGVSFVKNWAFPSEKHPLLGIRRSSRPH